MLDQPIDEDEYEHEHDDYLSDSSNSSQFSLRKRYLSLDLQKLIDKLEPTDDSSAVHSKYYQANVNETIEEEISDHDDEYDKKSRLSHSSKSSNQKRAKKGKGDHYLSFMSIISDRLRRARSHICELESESIAEELEECDL